jgi:hypothetical protein
MRGRLTRFALLSKSAGTHFTNPVEKALEKGREEPEDK